MKPFTYLVGVEFEKRMFNQLKTERTMQEFIVYADLTMCVHAVVTANNEEEAKEIAMRKINENPFEYARKADAYVDAEVTDVVK